VADLVRLFEALEHEGDLLCIHDFDPGSGLDFQQFAGNQDLTPASVTPSERRTFVNEAWNLSGSARMAVSQRGPSTWFEYPVEGEGVNCPGRRGIDSDYRKSCRRK
jgi:hypothetical protein